MKNRIANIKQNPGLFIGILLVGILLGWLVLPSGEKSSQASTAIEGHEGHDHESEDPGTWTCSMHPQIRQPRPGTCPLCGMDLIPAAEDGGGAGNHHERHPPKPRTEEPVANGRHLRHPSLAGRR